MWPPYGRSAACDNSIGYDCQTDPIRQADRRTFPQAFPWISDRFVEANIRPCIRSSYPSHTPLHASSAARVRIKRPCPVQPHVAVPQVTTPSRILRLPEGKNCGAVASATLKTAAFSGRGSTFPLFRSRHGERISSPALFVIFGRMHPPAFREAAATNHPNRR
jgi:hypothetical protein